MKRDSIRSQWAMRLVQFIFLRIENLVRYVDLENMQPDPENDMREARDVS